MIRQSVDPRWVVSFLRQLVDRGLLPMLLMTPRL